MQGQYIYYCHCKSWHSFEKSDTQYKGRQEKLRKQRYGKMKKLTLIEVQELLGATSNHKATLLRSLTRKGFKYTTEGRGKKTLVMLMEEPQEVFESVMGFDTGHKTAMAKLLLLLDSTPNKRIIETDKKTAESLGVSVSALTKARLELADMGWVTGLTEITKMFNEDRSLEAEVIVFMIGGKRASYEDWCNYWANKRNYESEILRESETFTTSTKTASNQAMSLMMAEHGPAYSIKARILNKELTDRQREFLKGFKTKEEKGL